MRGGFTEFCLWLLLCFICAGYFLALPGCVANAVLDWNGDLAMKLQPVYDGLEVVCPIAIEGAELVGEDEDEIRDICDKIDKSMKEIQKLQEVVVKAAGGEPCLENCSE